MSTAMSELRRCEGGQIVFWRFRCGTARAIEEQAEFVGWWDKNVLPDGRPKKTGADRGRFPRIKLEEETGITHQQVSRWGKSLKDRDGSGLSGLVSGPLRPIPAANGSRPPHGSGSGQIAAHGAIQRDFRGVP